MLMNLQEPNVLKVRKHEVFVAREVPAATVMVTGDWHISPVVSDLQYEYLKQAISVANPDLIMLTGDIVDSPVELKRETSVRKLVRELLLCSKAAPTVMVLGSHDFITPTRPARVASRFALPRWRSLCDKCGVTLLLDEFFETDFLRVFGAFQDERCVLTYDKTGSLRHFDNVYEFEQKLSQFDFSSEVLSLDKANWFLSHAPMVNAKVAEDLAGFDILSFGHTHGGIVPRGLDDAFDKLGVNFGLISPHKRPFAPVARGMMPVGDGSLMLINGGMVGAQFAAPKTLRQLNHVKAAEVSVVEIQPES